LQGSKNVHAVGTILVAIWYHNDVVANLTIKKLPDSVYRRLKTHARLHGRSLNAQVIHMLQSDLEDRARLEKMRVSSDDLERFVASLPPMDDSAPLIREDRERDS
jgi:plasmid stability protein